jgi:hypothetical protein
VDDAADAAVQDAGLIHSRTGSVTISADSHRDIIAGGRDHRGGQEGVGATLMVTVVGASSPRIPRTASSERRPTRRTRAEAADHLRPGRRDGQIFGESNGAAKDYEITDLNATLEGDGNRQSETQIGGDDGSFDGDPAT